MKLFAQIRKVDEAKRLVFGRIAQEVVDKADEVMDYASSKPHFQKWSEEVAKDTDGKSLGNVRAMHGKVAAGKLTEIHFDDADRAIDVCAKVVDDGEWKKVLEGVYTGFSIGGSYVGEKKVEKADGRDVTRYTAKPSEVSLVDRPCMPTARFFEVQKADGTLAKVDFAAQPADDVPDVQVVGTAEDVAELGKLMNAHGLAIGDLIKGMPAFLKDKEKGGDKPAGDADGDEGKGTPKGDGDSDEMSDEDKKAAADAAAAAAAAEAEKALAAAALQKAAAAEPNELQKLAGQVDTLTKLVSDQAELLKSQAAQIEKLSAAPAPARIALRAIAKSDDLGSTAAPLKKDEPTPIVDDRGEKHEAAGLIKALHSTGGQPLRIR